MRRMRHEHTHLCGQNNIVVVSRSRVASMRDRVDPKLVQTRLRHGRGSRAAGGWPMRDDAGERSAQRAEQLPPPSTQNLEQCGWQSFTAPAVNMPPSALAASAKVAPISKAGS